MGVSPHAVSFSKLPHPEVWRASQLSQPDRRCLDTGYAALSAQLPGRGWPCASLIELLAPRHGIGEIRLLRPALASLPVHRSVVLLQPPCLPNLAGWMTWQQDPGQLLCLRPQTANDAFWAADQVLRNGHCAALLSWFDSIPADVLRRLHAAAARHADVLFVVMRPLHAARQPSPALLRLALQPAPGGVLVRFVKRRGPVRDLPLYVELRAETRSAPAAAPSQGAPADMPLSSSLVSHASVDRPSSVSAKPERSASSVGV